MKKIEWEKVQPDITRSKVPGGWLICNTNAVDCLTQLLFLPDPDYLWLKDDPTKITHEVTSWSINKDTPRELVTTIYEKACKWQTEGKTVTENWTVRR